MINGHRLIRSLGTSDWARALRRLEQLVAAPEAVRVKAVTFAQAVCEFRVSRQDLNLKPASQRTYQQTFQNLPETLLARPLAGIDREALEAHISQRPISPGSRRNELKHLRTLFAWVLRYRETWGLQSNPAKSIPLPRIEELVTQPLTREEVDRILAATDLAREYRYTFTPEARRRARALVLTLTYTGLRVSDVATLRRDRLQGDHLTLRIQKNGVPIKLLLNADARRALEALPAPDGNPTYFFWSGNGSPRGAIQTVWRTIERLGRRAGVAHLHPHRFRDTFAVELLTQGADIRTVQKLLGHKSVQTTEKHYAHFVAAHQALLDSAVAKLDFTAPAGRPLLVDPLKHRRRDA
jgi:integrase